MIRYKISKIYKITKKEIFFYHHNYIMKRKKTKKLSIRKARTISKKKYSQLLKKKKTRKRMSKKEKKDLDKALFVNYCKCIKKIKYSKSYKKGAEYPICLTSVYKKRGITPPKNIIKKCKHYK
jgi:hypothetical protein